METNGITVVHVKRHQGPSVYIGRRYQGLQASPLANRFRLFDESQRQEVIEHYRAWLMNELRTQPGGKAAQEIERLAAMLRAGDEVTLACWCAPKACHGDVVAEVVRTVAEVVPV